ncbi:ABC transporter substrate-binding protein [Geodermatophilus sp. TF02-6]|uniref:ABC transporter substrate-binding protein n=1 Tax=Geodermatophilus sp. TF02-6 TaxID=2250575 RepID=UPI001314DCE0|nr:ABC transporter substrate-binding protein [Geodermatophilus sp. TF02-6]
MPTLNKGLLASLTALSVALVTGCSGGSTGDEASADGGGYGECEVYGEAGSISLEPVTDGVLTVQTTLPSPGWWKGETPDSIVGGYEYCLAANIAHRAGLDAVEVENVSFDALVAGQTQDFDIAMAQISVTPEREKVVTFSAPYFDSNLGVLAPADADVTEDDIRERTVGVQLGTTSVAWAQDQLKPNTEPQLFQDTTSMVTAVSSGVVDVAVQDTAIMLGFAKNSGGTLKVVGQFESGEKYAAIYPKDSTSGETMNQAIDAMRQDGTLDELSATWLGPELGGDPATVPVWSLR